MFLAPPLLATSHGLLYRSPSTSAAYNIADADRLSVWMSSNFSSNRYSSYNVSPILVKLGTHDLCANMQKKLLNRFFRMIKIFGDFFLNFKFGLSLGNSSSGAI